MNTRILAGGFALALGLAGWSSNAYAVPITLDFDSPATGSLLESSPLVTSVGTITASIPLGGDLYVWEAGTSGLTGDVLRFDETADGQYGQLAFDFDVKSVSFNFAGFLSGVFTAQVLDASLTVLDSFFDSDTNNDLPGGPVVLSGSGIRYFRFFDGPGGLSFAGVDDLIITPVPVPAALPLFATALAGVCFFGWRRKSAARTAA